MRREAKRKHGKGRSLRLPIACACTVSIGGRLPITDIGRDSVCTGKLLLNVANYKNRQGIDRDGKHAAFYVPLKNASIL